MMPPLTERQQAVLLYCHAYAQQHGWAASIQEIGDELKINYNTVVYNLQRLAAKDYIDFRGSRQIKVLMLP